MTYYIRLSIELRNDKSAAGCCGEQQFELVVGESVTVTDLSQAFRVSAVTLHYQLSQVDFDKTSR